MNNTKPDKKKILKVFKVVSHIIDEEEMTSAEIMMLIICLTRKITKRDKIFVAEKLLKEVL